MNTGDSSDRLITPGASRGRPAAGRPKHSAGPVVLALAIGLALVGSPARAQSPQAVAPDASLAGSQDWRCEVPAALTESRFAIARTATKLRQSEAVRIVAIGSSSTEGVGASSPSATYPARLQTELAALFPHVPITVVNKGIGGQTSHQVVERLARDVLGEGPDLVIWQTGTNSALTRGSPEALVEDLLQGISIVQDAGIDVMLMGPQKAPKFDATPDARKLLEQIAAAADVRQVPLFHRYEVMSYWLSHGQLTEVSAIASDGLHMTDQSYYCLGHVMARMISNLASSTMASRR
jgi:lysophospholipase L1-like esterase